MARSHRTTNIRPGSKRQWKVTVADLDESTAKRASFEITRTADVHRPVLLLHAVAERQRWKAEYTAAQLATSDPLSDNRSATNDQAA
ncbi:MAG: hypothetical protein LC749_08565 [Actinobacteria bacterium]|nr:hypothetical protein [Actinomycetota bacterium]